MVRRVKQMHNAEQRTNGGTHDRKKKPNAVAATAKKSGQSRNIRISSTDLAV